MTIHIDRTLHTNGCINVKAWNFAVQIGFTVGRCDCGAPANGQRIVEQPGITWATLSCPKHGEAVYRVRELAAA